MNVTTDPECAWTATADVGWIQDLVPASGQGSRDVQFRVTTNPDGVTRQGVVVVNDARATIRQEPTPCRFEVASSTTEFGEEGGTATLQITTAAGCAWTASTTAGWIVVQTPVSGAGSGSVAYRVMENTGPERSGTIGVGGTQIRVTQASAAEDSAPCTRSVEPRSASFSSVGGSGAINVTTAAGCAWEAVSTVPWITITAGATSRGTGTVVFSVSANAGGRREGTLEVFGATITVTQAAVAASQCTAIVNPTTHSVAASGASGVGVNVMTGTGCPWTATSNAGWITITAGAAGTASGSVAFSVAANAGSSRTGTMTVAGVPVTVTQAAGCSYTLTPTSQSVGSAGGPAAPVAVSTGSACAWSAASNVPWLTITSGPTGTGSGGVSFSVAANPGSARTGTLTIAGQTFTVSQSAGCTYSITPTSQSIESSGGPGRRITVSAPSGCAWTAASNNDWLTQTAPPSGTGDGTVTFQVAPNTGAARTGTLTIAGQTFTVSQAAPCTYAINPVSQTIDVAGGAGQPISVSAPAGCAWTAVSNDDWISITSGASGSGSGTVMFAAERLNGSGRTGTLTIAGQTFTLSQNRNDRR